MSKTERLENPTKYYEKISDVKHKCKCSHTVIIPEFIDRQLCDYCGHWIYRNPKLEFEYKLREEMKKNDNK